MCLTLAPIEKLSDDLLAQILRRLSFPFLLQCCKPVSKQFLRVISDPSFLHPRHHLSPPCASETRTQFILFHFRSGSVYNKMILFSLESNKKAHILEGSDFLPRSWPNDQDRHRDRVRVRATHLDLLLCSTKNNSHTHYFVCNPFTNQYVALPPLRKIHSSSPEMARVGLMLDQSRSRFRVLHIPIECFRYVSTFKVNMFSSETGEWDASDVTISHNFYDGDRFLLTYSFCNNIMVHNGKFVWMMKKRCLFVCDPFDNNGSEWRQIPIHSCLPELDICHGICNGLVKTCYLFLNSENPKYGVYELVNFEEGTWSASVDDLKYRVSMNGMNLLAFHPHCDHMMYFYSKKGIFLCDFKNQKLEALYTAAADHEDISDPSSVMSLVLPPWPTPVPTINNAAKLHE